MARICDGDRPVRFAITGMDTSEVRSSVKMCSSSSLEIRVFIGFLLLSCQKGPPSAGASTSNDKHDYACQRYSCCIVMVSDSGNNIRSLIE
jgi:hypothetical protein